ncbi:MAG: hypothetical protein EXQ91_01115 [Alphaproteobacteria bacterium]|nr:hypothetical protein [Alphaproteobacteria bacterium]
MTAPRPNNAPAVLDRALEARIEDALTTIFPWRRTVAGRRARNFLGVALPPGCGGDAPDPATGLCTTRLPRIEDGETFFEGVST